METPALRGVIFACDGRPVVPGVIVEFVSQEPGAWTVQSRAMTDEDGAFVIDNIPDGDYRVRLRYSQFRSEQGETVCWVQAPYYITLRENREEPLLLDAPATETVICRPPITTGCVVSGIIYGTNGQPVRSGVKIFLLVSEAGVWRERYRSTLSDSNGYYSFTSNVVAGSYRAKFRYPGNALNPTCWVWVADPDPYVVPDIPSASIPIHAPCDCANRA